MYAREPAGKYGAMLPSLIFTAKEAAEPSGTGKCFTLTGITRF